MSMLIWYSDDIVSCKWKQLKAGELLKSDSLGADNSEN